MTSTVQLHFHTCRGDPMWSPASGVKSGFIGDIALVGSDALVAPL
ncbi:MAG TPA: hypothetical protein PLV03_07000 [Clostridiales bacterium]|nr:hypothetical protein [Clostridiales bacterium]